MRWNMRPWYLKFSTPGSRGAAPWDLYMPVLAMASLQL